MAKTQKPFKTFRFECLRGHWHYHYAEDMSDDEKRAALRSAEQDCYICKDEDDNRNGTG